MTSANLSEDKRPPIELRRWFVALVGVIGYALALISLWLVRSALPPENAGALAGVTILFIGALVGIPRALAMYLPLVLLRLFPGLEK